MKKKEKQEKWMMTATVALSVVFAVAIFMVFAVFSVLIVETIDSIVSSCVHYWKGLVRIGIFILYICIDFKNGRYPAHIYVPWCRAQMHQLH